MNIRLTEAELKKLARNVKRSGLSTSGYVRTLISGSQPRELPPLDFHRLIEEMRKCNQAISELIRVARQTGQLDIDDLRQHVNGYGKELLAIQMAVLLLSIQPQ